MRNTPPDIFTGSINNDDQVATPDDIGTLVANSILYAATDTSEPLSHYDKHPLVTQDPVLATWAPKVVVHRGYIFEGRAVGVVMPGADGYSPLIYGQKSDHKGNVLALFVEVNADSKTARLRVERFRGADHNNPKRILAADLTAEQARRLSEDLAISPQVAGFQPPSQHMARVALLTQLV